MPLSLHSSSFMCWLYLTMPFYTMLHVSVYCSDVSDDGDLYYQPIISLSLTCHLVPLGLSAKRELNHLISDSVQHSFA